MKVKSKEYILDNIKDLIENKNITLRKHKLKKTDKTDTAKNQIEEYKLKELKIVLNRVDTERMTGRVTEFIKPASTLKLEGSLSENWRCFKRDFEIFLTAAELNGKSDVVKINLFLNAAGPDAVEMYESLHLTEVQKASYTETVAAFERFCNQRKNTVYERFLFYQRKQKEIEPFDTFFTDITRLSRSCEFGETQEERVRDQIVMGVNDTKLQARLLQISDLTCAMAVEKSRAHEVTRAQATNMNEASASVNEIRSTQNSQNLLSQPQRSNNNAQRSSNGRAQHTPIRQQQQRNTNNTNTYQNQNYISGRTNNINNNEFFKCNRCNLNHKLRECPAFGKTCNICTKLNHFAVCCRSRNISTIENDIDDDNMEFFIGTIDSVRVAEGEIDTVKYPWTEKIKVINTEIYHKIDTGAEMNVMPLNIVKDLLPTIELQQTQVTLRAFGGQRIRPNGMCTLKSVYNGMLRKIKYAVVDLNIMPILGLDACIAFKIVQPLHSMNKKKNNQSQPNHI